MTAPPANSIEISVKGRWVSVPALRLNDNAVIITGTIPRIASIHDEAWSDKVIDDYSPYIRALKTGGLLRADIFTFSEVQPCAEWTFAYVMEQESIAGLRFEGFQDWWHKLPQGTRKNVRRAEKRGVRIEVRPCSDEVLQDIVELNNASRFRQGRPNRHFGKTLEQVKKDYASFLERSDLICAYLGDELIGLLKLVYRGGDTASILQCLPKGSHLDKYPANALIAACVKLCESKGVSYLTYGMFRYGTRRESSLLEFKLRNGFGESLVPRYFVPLTPLGAVCLRLKLHRGLVGILPQNLVEISVSAREKWHAFRASQGASMRVPPGQSSNNGNETPTGTKG